MAQLAQEAKIRSVAKKILAMSRNNLVVHMRFMDMAINKLPLIENWEIGEDGIEGSSISVNGRAITYNPIYILQCYAHDKNIVTRLYLHEILHCTFLHFYVNPRIDRVLWDLACDIAVENIIDQLAETEEYLVVEHEIDRQGELDRIREGAGFMTAERIYRYFLDLQMDEEQIRKLYEIFAIDDHRPWYAERPPMELTKDDFKQVDDDRTDSRDEDDEDGGTAPKGGEDDEEDEQEPEDDGFEDIEEKFAEKEMQDALDEWEDISKHMQMDLETFSKEKGESVGDLLINIKAVTREKYDYTAFLKKFASMGEKMMIDDDEFDYIYYTYGLSMYKNMPLVEPLEYKETDLVKEFVIAIDTSFSVHGDEVMAFIKKTYNILKATESFSQHINLHIIQCDVKVQHDEKITSQAELDKYMANMLLYGFGGTDFRPVFEYVNELIDKKEFSNLKGLIYFTDGFGTFPEIPPKYKTAFAFVSDDITFDPVVPPWAIKLILEPEDLKEE